MLLPVMIGCCAFIFYRIGEMDYGRGGPVAILSVVLSLLAVRLAPPLSLIAVGASQVLLYLALLIFNMIRKTPPRT